MKLKFRDPRVGETPDTAIRRLTNIRPREVSLVDAAANGREFLIVKRKDAMKNRDKTLFKGGQKTDQNVDNKRTQDVGETETHIEKKFLADVEEMLQGIPLAKALASEQKDMFIAMSDALFSLGMSMDMIRSDLMSFANSDGGTHFLGQPIEKCSEEIRKSIEGIEDGLTDTVFEKLVELVEKKGRKMKKTRLEKLKGLIEGLTSLAKELEGSNGNSASNGGSEVKKQEQGSTENQSAEGASFNEEVNKNANTSADSDNGGSGSEVQKNAGDDLAKVVEAAVNKAVKPLQERIDKLEGTPAASSSEGSNDTEDPETVNKSEGETEVKKGGKSFWAGVL